MIEGPIQYCRKLVQEEVDFNTLPTEIRVREFIPKTSKNVLLVTLLQTPIEPIIYTRQYQIKVLNIFKSTIKMSAA